MKKSNTGKLISVFIITVFSSLNCSGQTFETLLDPEKDAVTEIDIQSISYGGTNSCDNNTCGIGDTIDFTVTFAEPVNIASGQSVQIMIGDNEYIEITGPVNGTSATGTYTVSAGDDITSITPNGTINATGGTLTDSNGSTADVDLGSGLAGSAIAGTSGFTIDASAPEISAIAYNSDTCGGSACSATETVTFDVTFSEAVDLDAGDTVEIPIGSNGEKIIITGPLTDATSASGVYTVADGHETSFIPTGSVANNDNNTDGDAAADNAGNALSASIGSGAQTVTGIPGGLSVDLNNPDAPTSLALASDDDKGGLDNDGVTNLTTGLTITGNAEAGSTVKIFDGATSLGTTTATAVGTFSIDINLAAGSTYNLTAKASDAGGNESPASSALSLTVDTAAPSAPSGSPSITTGSDTGISDSDGITSATSIAFSGSAGAVENNATVGFYDGSTLLGTTTAAADGSYSATLDLSSLANSGSKSITIKQTDLAGNGPSGDSGTFSLTIDTNAPSAPVTAPDLAAGSDTGNNSDNITSETAVTIEATAGSVTGGALIRFYDGSTVLGTTTANVDGSYSTSLDLSSLANAGEKTITTTQLDTAGNESGVSGGLDITIDTQTPDAPTVAPDMAAGSDTGNSDSDNFTKNTTVTFTAPAGTVDSGATIGFYDGATLLDSGTANADGSYSIAADLSGIENAGAQAVTVKQTDVADNGPSADSASLTVSIDTTVPTISGVAPASSASVNNTLVSYNFSEICGEATITWSRTGGSADSSAPHAVSLTGSELNAGARSNVILTNNPTLADGTVYSISFECTDRAGNAATTVTSTNVTFSDAALEIVSSKTVDRDGNGKIDAYRVAFNKNVDDSTFPGYSENSSGSVSTDWLVAGYTDVKLVHGTAVSWATDTVDDAVIYLGFNETLTECSSANQAGCDTGAKPDLTTSASPALQDAATNTLAQVESIDVTEADGARPVLIAAKSLGADKVDVIFSEAMEQTTAETSAYYSIDNGITVSAASQDATSNKVVHLTTGTQTGGTTYTLTVNTDIKDTANFSLASGQNTATFDGLVKPVVSSIVTQSATTLLLTFNEAIVASTMECSSLTTCADIYENTSLPVKEAVSQAGAGTDSDKVILTVNDMIEGQNYTTEVKAGTAQSVASSETIGSINNTATFTGDGRPGVVISADTATECGSAAAKRIVIQYDQNVSTGATTTSNYKITQCESGSCSTGLSGGNQNGASSVTDQGANKYYVDFAEAFNTSGDVYRLNISGVEDTDGNEVATPTNLSFQCGSDTTAPVLIAADVIGSDNASTQIMLTFSEEVDQVTANTASNYQYDSGGYGSNVNSAAKQSNPAQVLVTFAPGLSDGGHQISVQNVEDLQSNVIITNGTNNVQPVIVDAPEGFQGGTVFTDPFGDDTPAGQIVVYDGKLYLGADKEAAKLFETDYGLTTSRTITLDADGTPGAPIEDFNGYTTTYSDSGSQSTDKTTKGVDTLYAACVGGTSNPIMTGSECTDAGGSELFFIGSLNISGKYRSYWLSSDKSSSTTTFTFSEQANPDPGGGWAFRSTVLLVFKDQLFSHFGAEAGGGNRGGRICVNPSGCDGLSYLDGVALSNMSDVTRIGTNGTIKNGSQDDALNGESEGGSHGDYLNAINILYEHDNDGSGSNESQLYAANGGVFDNYNVASGNDALGSARVDYSDGGIVRTKLAYSSRSSLPPDCSGAADCDIYWEDVTPDSNTDWNSYVSIPYPENSAVTGSANCSSSNIEMDCSLPYNIFVPAMKAIPYMRTAPNGDLYMLRNACSTTTVCYNGSSTCDFRTSRQVCPKGSEVPQLWMLPKGSTASPSGASDWVLVAEYGSSGKTSMAGNTTECDSSGTNICLNNTHITLLEFVGNHLYIGFDNSTNGSNIWRTDMSSVSSGSLPAESSFEMVNITGLDGSASNQRIFSHVTVNDSGTDWLIITTRDGTNAMQIYRTANDQD